MTDITGYVILKYNKLKALFGDDDDDDCCFTATFVHKVG